MAIGERRRTIFITGATGYLGQALVPELLSRGHFVRALIRSGSARKLPPGCAVVIGDALDGESFAGQVAPSDTLVHLVGVSHPAPWKAAEFERVDLASVRASIAAARAGGVSHVVYLSVAQPAPVMRSYQAARAEAERLIGVSGIAATFVRPWYVLGPGHRWPYALVPLYAALEAFPPTRQGARRLGLVRRPEMTAALVWAVEHPPSGVRLMPVEAIRTPTLLAVA